jgi:L-ascorbate metabolism protein UlaG (beta-lactamase superfamily)
MGATNNGAERRSSSSRTITWVGHATMVLEERGIRVVTDPLLTDRVAHLRRRRGATPGPTDVDADLVLISHLHHDHCHRPSLRRLAPGTRVVMPRGGAGVLAGLPLDVVEVAPGDEVSVGGVTVVAVRAFHDGRRHPRSRWVGPALGYVVHGSGATWFAGDTGWDDRLGRDVGPVDVALLPVGGWGPMSRPSTLGQHLGPDEAARVARSLPAAAVVPIHYGTFWPVGLRALRHPGFLGPGAQFREAMTRRAPDIEVHVLDPGTSMTRP